MYGAPVGVVGLIHELAQGQQCGTAWQRGYEEFPEECDAPVLSDRMPCRRSHGVAAGNGRGTAFIECGLT